VLHFAPLITLTLLTHQGGTMASAEGRQDSVATFPRVNGSALTRRKFSLPGDFGGELNIVLIAFKRNQQADVDSWTPHLKTVTAGQPGLRVYELPVLPKTLTLMRGIIDGGMRGGIPDSAVRAATITLYISKSPFKKALGIATEDHITVVLVDRAGKIYWRAMGVFAEPALQELQSTLARIRNPSP
jgi:hypothetical protein